MLDRLIQQRERRVAKDTAHRDMLVREGIIRLVPPFEETVVIDTVRLRKINGRADWKWRAVGLIPPRWGVARPQRSAKPGLLGILARPWGAGQRFKIPVGGSPDERAIYVGGLFAAAAGARRCRSLGLLARSKAP